jgi:hypothetical protein
MRDDLKYDEIVALLNDKASQIAEDCIPNGRVDGLYWRGDLCGKISVHIKGSRVGTVGAWQNQLGGKTGGNLVSLIELAYNCKSHGEAVRLAKERYLGMRKRELTEEEKRQWARQQEQSKLAAEKRKQDEERERQRKTVTVQDIWHSAVPIGGTLAEVYLRSREIDLERGIPGLDQWPPSLRFHAGLSHNGGKHPALICGVQNVDRKLVAVWRIFLGPDGKALTDGEGKKVKLGYGPAAGGAVRLGPATPILRVVEGVETSLGVQRLTRNSASVWACLSTSGMAGFVIPKGVKRLEIYSDGDRFRENIRTGGVDLPPGTKAAETLRDRARNEGIEAVIFPSPEPDDWLDVWQARKRDQRQKRSVQYQE